MANAPGKTAKPVSESNASSPAQSEFEAQIAILREEIAHLREEMAKAGDRSYDAARKAAAAGVEELKHRGEAVIEDLRNRSRHMEEQIAETVREKPFTALATAAAIGFFFALLARR
jgi:ElaB/YqjD/DUF883 family membrane-anchored ribosome-binding protein